MLTTTVKQETIESIINDAILFHEDIHLSISKENGLTAWYKSFVCSEAFNKLSEEEKAETFDLFSNLKDFLRLTDQNLNGSDE